MMLKEVDRIEVLTLMDNYVDLLLESTKGVTRPPKAKDGMISRDTLVGEHGLSLLVTVHEGREKHTVLFDTGHTGIGVLHNATHLEVDLGKIETIVGLCAPDADPLAAALASSCLRTEAARETGGR